MKKLLFYITGAFASLLLSVNTQAQAPAVSYSPNTITYNVGTAITPLTPTNTGGAMTPVGGTVTTLASAGSITYPAGVSTPDASGNVYVANQTADDILKITPAGVVSVFAGTFNTAAEVDGVGAAARFNYPTGIVMDPQGANLYVTDFNTSKIRRVNISTQQVTTIAGGGSGGAEKDNASGLAAVFITPIGVTITPDGKFLYVADGGGCTIRKVSTTSPYPVTTIAGTAGTVGSADGIGTNATFGRPWGITIDPQGANLYVADKITFLIRKINLSTLQVTTIAGSGVSGEVNNSTGTKATFKNPAGITCDPSGSYLLVGEGAAAGLTIRLISTQSPYRVMTFAGSTAGFVNASPATSAKFNDPYDIKIDNAGNFTVADYANAAIRKIGANAYSISPALPAGLVFSGLTGVISGTPAVASPATTYTITARNASGSASTTVTITTLGPTAPTVTTGTGCGVTRLIASGSTPAGGTYNWYTAATGGTLVYTGATYQPADLNTYYVDYTILGATTSPRVSSAGTALPVNPPIIATVPTTSAGIALSYSFTGGSTTDVSTNGNTAVLQGAPATTTDRYGYSGYAYNFNGTSQYITTTTQFPAPTASTAFSVSLWFQTSSAGGMLCDFANAQTVASGLYDRPIYMDNSGHINFGLYVTPGLKTITTAGTYADGNWHHVVVTFSPTNGSNLYVDGTLQGSNATMNTLQVYAGWWRLGYNNLAVFSNPPTNLYFKGALDDVVIYNSEISASQVNTLYGGWTSPACLNSVQLNVNTVAGCTYSWTGPNSFVSSLQNPTVSPVTAGSVYTAAVTTAGGCTSTVNVTLAATPTIALNPVIISTVPASGAYLSYAFTNGSATDASGSGNTALPQGSPVTTTDRYGQASSAFSFSFSGTTQYVASTNSINPGTNFNFSISLWFQTSTAGGVLAGLSNAQTGTGATQMDRVIYMDNTGHLYFGVYNGSAYKTISTAPAYADGSWHHVVATFSSTAGSNLYVDGVLQASDVTMTLAQTTGYTTGWWRFGYLNLSSSWSSISTNKYFTGSLDHIAVFNTALTQAQVNTYYGGGSTPVCLNTVQLGVNTVSGCTYAWTGPNNYSSTLQTPYLSPITAGTYTATVTNTSTGCASTLNVSVATATVAANPVILATVPTSNAYFAYAFTNGSTTDASGSGNTASLQASPLQTPDRYGQANSAYSLNGTNQYVTSTASIATPGPANFSVSVWFKTTTVTGGLLVGFGSVATGSSGIHDRAIYMDNTGKVYYELAPGGVVATISSTTAYNDGNWHQAIASTSSTGGSNLYIDGALIASSATMKTGATTAGYWRIGYDNLTGVTSVPTSYYFNGSIDDAAAYKSALNQDNVNTYYGAGPYFPACNGLVQLAANTVSGCTYAWTGPNSFSSSLQNPFTTLSNPGTYVLTATNTSTGCASTLNVTVPSSTSIAAFTFTWTGTTSTDPTVATNWSGNNLPTFDKYADLVIPASLSKYPVLTADLTAQDITIATGASLNLNGHTLNIGCNIINNATAGGTTGILYGGNIASGITLNGGTDQTYTVSNAANTAPTGKLTVNNTGGGTVTITGGPVDVYNTLTITQGNLAVDVSPAALTLKSTATQSASVAPLPLGSGITGNVTVERYITGGTGHRGYRLMSSPVYAGTDPYGNNVCSINYLSSTTYTSGSGGTSGGFSKAGTPSIYLFRENLGAAYYAHSFYTTGFRGVANMSASPSYSLDIDGTGWSIPAGNGFLNFFRGATGTASPYVTTSAPNAATVSTTGTLNQGTINVTTWFAPLADTLSYTAASPAVIQGYNLLGNPYASTINFEKFNRNGSGSSIYGDGFTAPATIWFFNPVTKQYCSYMQKTTMADTTSTDYSGTANSSDGYATNLIASGEGFFVRTTGAGQTFTFLESAKTSAQPSSGSISNLMGMPKAVARQPEPYLRVRLVKDSVNTDEVVLALNDHDTTAYSYHKDALDLGGNGAQESLSLLSSDKVQLCIHRRSLPHQTAQVVPLLVDATTTGIYQMKRIQLNDLPRLYDVWLMDAYKRDSLDMRANDTYAFNIYKNDTASFGAKRFTLVIRQNQAYAYRLLNFTATKAPGAIARVQLAWMTENEADYTNFTVEKSTDGGKTFDAVGGLWGSTAGSYSLMDKNPIIGTNLYRLKQIDVNNAVTYSNIIPVQYAPLSNSIAGGLVLYPNPAKTTINLTIVQNALAASNAPAASYKIIITSSSGVTVRTAVLSGNTWQASVSSLVPGTYQVLVLNSSDNKVVGKTKFVKI